MDMTDTVRVLLIEDDAEFAQLYRTRLELDDYRVAWAKDGRAGLEMIQSWQPDMVLLDMRMPEMDGLEVLRALRADPDAADIPVVVLSNYSDPEQRRQAAELGALEWVVKVDATPQALASSIRRWATISATVEDEESARRRGPSVRRRG
jgi:CheY-like chemotaxis protein